MHYVIAIGSTAGKLEVNVNELIAKGYHPHGALLYARDFYSTQDKSGWCLAQVMIKEEDV